ncbi:DUF3299 domain-containing protein [Vibrio sp. WXL103]|uniref:DUF3299 domain-containing protein n=1 Tax=unclassified Vibrio TaxID=2614977 RepID=UPI003EC69FB7
MIKMLLVIGLSAWSSLVAAALTPLSWQELIPLEERHQGLIQPINHDIPLDVQAPQIRQGSMVTDLNNTEQTLAGFVVPLGIEANKITEFLLVPFFGACLHIPPPPPNQLILVEQAIDYVEPWEPIVLQGTLKVQTHTSDDIESGYRLETKGEYTLLSSL